MNTSAVKVPEAYGLQCELKALEARRQRIAEERAVNDAHQMSRRKQLDDRLDAEEARLKKALAKAEQAAAISCGIGSTVYFRGSRAEPRLVCEVAAHGKRFVSLVDPNNGRQGNSYTGLDELLEDIRLGMYTVVPQ